jgi:hypothetical protein
MCDCIKNINADLKAAGQCNDATMFGESKATTMLIRTDTWVHEKRRNKPTRIIASFCPFCGEKYGAKDGEHALDGQPTVQAAAVSSGEDVR